MFICKEDYLDMHIEQQPAYIRITINKYISHAIENGARIADDGYPDSRFKATYGNEFEYVRKLISRLRNAYNYEYPNIVHVINKAKFMERIRRN